PYHIENRADVCLIGWEVAQQLFSNVAPLGQSVHISRNDNAFVCRVIGILKSQSSNSEWIKPNLQIIIPFTFFPFVYGGGDAQINESVFQIDAGADMEKTSQSIKAFFEQKYGKSGRFSADSDSVLIAQMKKFLNLFSILLGAIAIISLIVGGIGITNMMLVSVNERFKEIGIRKAVGATDLSIRFQFLLEAMILCCVAGVLGLVMGFSVYELLIYGASKFVTKLQFEWVVDWGALIISVVSTLVVGLASGLMPALKAERLQVIEALRTE
ncbi:FtsX-like permease family protein, partial [Bdellovibrionota bacterium FG-2]